MSYNDDFYNSYMEYLKEKVVRRNHDYMFDLFSNIFEVTTFSEEADLAVLDLGCGLGEYSKYDTAHVDYVGVDLNNTGNVSNFIQTDYSEVEKLAGKLPFTPNSFISLFSIECCFSVEEKYILYKKIFEQFPLIQCGLVGGFFYESKKEQEKIVETGGIESYQTIEDQSLFISDIFREFRVYMHTPSEMFGEDVVEVWKIFVRSA